jgi:hypothetical protein
VFRTTSAAILVTAIILSACTGSEATTTTTDAEVVPTTAVPTTAAVKPTTTTTPADPTTTTLQDGAVGSREALLEAMQPAIESTVIRHEVDASEVPVPNINEPDPLFAVAELLALDFWAYSNAPVGSWAGILALEGSPQWSEYVGAYNLLGGRTAAFEDPNPFEILELRRPVPTEEAAVPADVLAAAPGGSVIVFYRTRLDPHVVSTPEEPDSAATREGWGDEARLAVISPTDVGWQFYWSQSQ